VDSAVREAEQPLHRAQLARRQVMRELRSRVDVLEGRLPSSQLPGGL
jgi:hypothetical protein